MIYKCKHFPIDELVYPELYEAAKGADTLYKCFDLNLRVGVDRIREFVNTPVTINNWKTGGQFKHSGLRPQSPIHKVEGALLSSHKFGNASDLKFNSAQWTPEKLREHMKAIGCFEDGFLTRTDAEAFPFLTIRRIEWMPNMSWFHMDTLEEAENCTKILVFTG